MDWMNPTDEMLAGREAGRRDWAVEKERLQAEVDYTRESLDEYKGETRLAYDKALHDIDREIRHAQWIIRRLLIGSPVVVQRGLYDRAIQWKSSRDKVVKAFVDVIKDGDK